MELIKGGPREVLRKVVEAQELAIMSYSSHDKYHIAKVLLTKIGANVLDVEIAWKKKPYPVNINVAHVVGMSVKHGYGKLIFETKVVGLKPSSHSQGSGIIELEIPGQIELVSRRSYFRVEIPKPLEVKAALWHCNNRGDNKLSSSKSGLCGRIVDISAGGIQIVIDAANGREFKKGQYIRIQFTPMPSEMPLVFNAQVRTVFPTANGKNMCLGMQIVGLEASSQGRTVLQKLCQAVESYHRMNQTDARYFSHD